jgi:predicted Zn-dependent protease
VLVVPPAKKDTVEQVQVEKIPEMEPVARVERQRDDSPVAGKPLAPPEEATGTVPAVSSALTAASGGTVDDFTVGKIVGAPATAEQIISSEVAVESEQPGEQEGETGTVAEPPQTEIRALAESTPSETEDAVSTTVSEPRLSAVNTLYRGPQDQLTHARNLAEVRKFWESEQVLKDLLSQSPPSPIQEEASLLLVKVLNNQNRAAEAQRALDSAKEQFPASEMIQTYELGSNGDKPIP